MKIKDIPLNQLEKANTNSIKNIIKDLSCKKRSNICPEWDCATCEKVFPKCEPHGSCPCFSGYTKQSLIYKLKQILNRIEKETI